MQNVFQHIVFFFSGKYYGTVLNKVLNGQSIGNYKSLFWLTANDFLDKEFPELVTATGYCWFDGIQQKYHCTEMGLVLVVQDQDLNWMLENKQTHPTSGVQYIPLEQAAISIQKGNLISKSYAQTLEREMQEIERLNAEAEKSRKHQQMREEVEKILQTHTQNHSDPAAVAKAIAAMKVHDYYYTYSDDIRVYRRGNEERQKIDAEFARLNLPLELIRQYHTGQ